jgi:17beta-estradiol 17-dehydrogenase / very-long-chain 3-oxoacyl-CoA reductase
VVTLFGYAALAYVAYRAFKILYEIVYPFFIATPKNLQSLAGAKWAVITGSTDGIGKAYAFELARKGFDLLLISRNSEKLETVAKEIREKYNSVEIRNIAFDFTNGNLKDYEAKLLSELRKIEIGVLVNNVGLSYEYPERLHEIDGGIQRVADITVINTLPVTVLTAAVLPQMAKRHKGVVINVASSAAYFPMAYWAIYTATKKYVTWLSDVLRKEYATSGVTIQTVCPMLVATNMSKVRRTSYFTPNAEQFAKAAVRTIGNIGETTGYYTHQIQASLLWNLPPFIIDKIVTADSIKTRARALKKKEAAAKSE